MKKFWWGIFFGVLIGALLLYPESDFSNRIRQSFYVLQDSIVFLLDSISDYTSQQFLAFLFVVAVILLGLLFNYLYDLSFPVESGIDIQLPAKEDPVDQTNSASENDRYLANKVIKIGDEVTSRIEKQASNLEKRGETFKKLGLILAFFYIISLTVIYTTDEASIVDIKSAENKFNAALLLIGLFVPGFSIYLIRLYWNSLHRINILNSELAQLRTDCLMFEMMTLCDGDSQRQMLQAYIERYPRVGE